jgi:hypothetical protein
MTALPERVSRVGKPPSPRIRGLEAELRDLERTDPEVGAARNEYDRMVERIVGRGPALSTEEIHRIYDAPEVAD